MLLDEDDEERADEIAAAVIESDLPVDTVLNKASKVKGETRVRDWEVLAGENTEVVHREYGCEFALDLAAVYFSRDSRRSATASPVRLQTASTRSTCSRASVRS